MLELKLAFSSLRRNIRQTCLFIFASSLMIAINYIFVNIHSNSTLNKLNYSQAIISLLSMAQKFTWLIATFFLLYANSFLLRQRDRELGLYNMLGMTKGQLRLILTVQKIMLYLASSLGGLILGVTFVKLALMFLKSLLKIAQLKETFTFKTLGITLLSFGVIFLCLLVYDFWRLRKVKPALLWQQAFTAEKAPKANWFLGISGLIILASGYFIAIKTKANLAGFSNFMLAIALVVIGTYLVFIAGSISLLKLLQKNQHFYYQPQHFIAISGMLYRMKQNAAGLATICILCTAILVSLVSSISLVVGQQRLLNFWNPFDLMLTTSKPLNQNLLKQLAAKNQIKLEKQQQIKMTAPIVGSLDQRGNFKSGYNAKTSTTLLVLTVKTFNQIEGTNYHLKNNQVLLSVADKKVYPQLKIKQKSYQVIGYPTLQAGNVQHSIFQPVYVIAANTASAKQIGSSTWIYQNGINFKSSYQHGLNFTRQIQQQLKLDNGSVSNKQEMQHFLRVIFGGLLFVGCLVSLAMAITTALIIYYKQLSEGLADQQRFKKMQQVGLSYAESKKAIQSQVLLVFMLPIVGAIVHMAFALPAIISILKMFSLFDQGLLLKVCLLIIALLTAGYLMVYGLTTRIYQRYIIN